MEYRYLAIKDDGSFDIRSERFPSSDWAFKTMEGTIFPCLIYDAICLSDELVSLGGMNHYISTLKAISMDDVKTLQADDNKNLMLKETVHKLPDPFIEKLAPFTSAVVMACRTNAKQIALTKEQHQNKLTIIRVVRGFVDTDNELTLKKAEELLGYYGLSIIDVIKTELIVNSKG